MLIYPKELEQATLLKIIADLLQKRKKSEYKKSLIRESSVINAVNIISEVNELLDKKLFEATVLNEMSSLIERRIDNFEDIVKIVMGTLAKILEYDVAAIVTLEEHNVENFLKLIIR